jgi:hypothetical protein
VPYGNVAKWLITNRGTVYAAAMHLRFYHDRYDPLITTPLSQEDRLRMGVMFFRQGANFDNRYAGQMVQRGNGAVTVSEVETKLWQGHNVHPSLQGKTTPNIPQQGHDSYVPDYGNKILQLPWLLAPSKE